MQLRPCKAKLLCATMQLAGANELLCRLVSSSVGRSPLPAIKAGEQWGFINPPPCL